jgi:hypothetical protein
VNYVVKQPHEDREVEAEYKVYIRSCSVVEKGDTDNIVRDNLHYLDAIALKRHLEKGHKLGDFQCHMSLAGYATRFIVPRVI